MIEEIQRLIVKAERSLAAVRRLIDSNDYDFAASRAYYTMFYAAEAILLSKNLSFSSHSALISALFKHFVKTGLMQKELHKSLHEAFKLRQEGDYMSSSNITKEIAEKLFDDAKTFIQQIAQLLKKD
jgi:uncharacterized protein (UPF0332 family)